MKNETKWGLPILVKIVSIILLVVEFSSITNQIPLPGMVGGLLYGLAESFQYDVMAKGETE